MADDVFKDGVISAKKSNSLLAKPLNFLSSSDLMSKPDKSSRTLGGPRDVLSAAALGVRADDFEMLVFVADTTDFLVLVTAVG